MKERKRKRGRDERKAGRKKREKMIKEGGLKERRMDRRKAMKGKKKE